ncbi:response regulator [Rhizobium halophytocola]|uniref:CheY-like chemotaxis protein n=1 Tax=Rhizobium halophytocola TaxID=735519 RepID=A0ABS4DVK0_9HYPH|nr:response regulator [Rhizobium halophytocola]MBP1849717.1 CheY-like chemotaxis protein [Rhizobium halophytocola]
MRLLAPVATETPKARAAGRILLVDDDRVGLAMLKSMLEALHYEVETAVNGAEAYTLLREDPGRADLVVTDRMMPVMDGLALTRRLKRDAQTAAIPVVLLTGASAADDISAGIEAGAFYYLAKPADQHLVTTVLESAMREVGRRRDLADKLGTNQAAFQNVQILRMTLSRPEETEPVCGLLASLHHQPEKIVQGIFELVQNAVEHGLLRFGLEAKAKFLATGQWQQALMTRSRDPAYQQGQVEATMIRQANALILTVKDPGPGFKWRPYLGADPSRASALCGRGISRANTLIFDRIAYNQTGNEVTAILQLDKKTKW